MTTFWLLAALVVAATWYLVDGRYSYFFPSGVAGMDLGWASPIGGTSIDLNHVMVCEGYAFAYRRYSNEYVSDERAGPVHDWRKVNR